MVNIDPEALAGSLAQLTPLHDRDPDQDVLQTLDRVVGACRTLFDVSGSGFMVADEQGDLHYVTATSAPGRILEDVQAETGEGPCVETYLSDRPVSTTDLARETRWPASRETITRHGVRAVLGVPIRLNGLAVGSLDVYLDRAHDWDDTEVDALERYGDVLEAVLVATLSAHRATTLAGQLQHALDSRILVDRAIGFLMGRADLAASAAFALLRTSARAQRRKVADVAREVLDTRALPRRPRA